MSTRFDFSIDVLVEQTRSYTLYADTLEEAVHKVCEDIRNNTRKYFVDTIEASAEVQEIYHVKNEGYKQTTERIINIVY